MGFHSKPADEEDEALPPVLVRVWLAEDNAVPPPPPPDLDRVWNEDKVLLAELVLALELEKVDDEEELEAIAALRLWDKGDVVAKPICPDKLCWVFLLSRC